MGRIPFNAGTSYKPLPPMNEKQLRDTFQKYDSNGDGLLSKAELENAFKSLGSHMPNWRARRALNHADANGDKFISLEELDEVVKYAAKHGYVLGK
uniref:EF-hand domain-containing protein n=1 Tax=Quercus lobata TaxID=97700 RepID=A0A7N2KRT4_QUELO